ncbi:MAG: DUF2189 domain-containing protein [Hyphomicrobiaceae bacterium]|nr:DUF2189 domain-containing protein [Hyphomicrobiaceae bacterium]
MTALTSMRAEPQFAGEVVPGIGIRRVPFDQPWEWLAAGWRDLWTHPGISLSYGAVFSGIAALMLWGMTLAGAQSIILALFGGFMIIGPLFSVGLYQVSRDIERGDTPTLGSALLAGFRPEGQLGFMGLVLFLIFMVWMQVAFLLFMLFTGAKAFPPPSEFLHMILFTPHGLGLLLVGTLVGAVLSVITFSVAAVSVPLLMVKDVDVVTAMRVSIRTVMENPRPMLLWAGLIAGFMVLGGVTLFIGLVLAFPLVGHATWHAFEDLVLIDDRSKG